MVFWRRKTTTLLVGAALILAFLYLHAEFDRHLDESDHEEFHQHLSHGDFDATVEGGRDRVTGTPGQTGWDEVRNTDMLAALGSAKAPESQHTLDDDEPAGAFWRAVPIRNPVKSPEALPSGTPLTFPRVQHAFATETATARKTRLSRLDAVKASFERCWTSYRKLAWGHDELAPLSGEARNPYGGWGATLVDSLDTLWIMGLKTEFEDAVAKATEVEFLPRSHDKINVFETNIRYLGGFISAYELSGDARLLRKAQEVGEMLYVAMDTHNRLPLPRMNLMLAAEGKEQVWDDASALADAGSFSMEFIRLSMLTGDPKWFDAAQRITAAFQKQQNDSYLPGLWPKLVNAHRDRLARDPNLGMGGNADSMYEYLLKTYLLSGGLLPEYKMMYEDAMEATVKHLLFRPRIADKDDMLMLGSVLAMPDADGKVEISLAPEMEHLACFAGGMFALGSKALGIASHTGIAKQLTQGCTWAYRSVPSGIMPEKFTLMKCDTLARCRWSQNMWSDEVITRSGFESRDRLADAYVAEKLVKEQRLPVGFTSIVDGSYLLRPEAIESIFVLYRTTGDVELLEAAWDMFQAIERQTKTKFGNAALKNVLADDRDGPRERHMDSMESFWMGETLKYFYLIFSEPELLSLDKWVFNTEAHPFKRLLPTAKD
jgi:mannosyl-oligosaccharide alpha-1,2-mannosidase